MLFSTPTTCFGETLKSGCLRLAEFCLIKSIGLLIIFTVDLFSTFHQPHPVYTLIPAALVLISLVKIGCNLLLYSGAKNGNARFMKPWFWVYTIQTGVLAVLGLGGSIFLAVRYSYNCEVAAIAYAGVLLYCTASKYFCQVVRALIVETERGHVYNDAIRPTPFSNEDA